MIQIYKMLIVLLTIFSLSCTTNKKSDTAEDLYLKMDSLEKKYIYERIEHFVSEYDVNEDETFRLENSKKSYPIDDSLCFYMDKLDKLELIDDDYFRFLMGKLLEKKYLGVRNYGKLDPEFFAVYNTSILYRKRMSNSFALNIALKDTMAIDKGFKEYAPARTEFVCIDSVVLVLDKLPQMQSDSNHRKCMYLVKNNKTGGCNW